MRLVDEATHSAHKFLTFGHSLSFFDTFWISNQNNPSIKKVKNNDRNIACKF